MDRALNAFVLVVSLSLGATTAAAEVPDAATAAADLGYSAAQIADVKAGKIVTGDSTPAHDRDLAAAFAFFVAVPPKELVKDVEAGLLAEVDPNTIAHGRILGEGTTAAFTALTLTPGADKRAKRYVTAKPGADLNLSAEEIAAFNALGSSADVAAVETQIRSSLLARFLAYRAKGLDGIAPYAREKGSRSVAGDLRTSFETAKRLQKYAPEAYAGMLRYPESEPPGTHDIFSWAHLKANDVPTIVLTHAMIVPDGDAYLVLQRQFYVSEGFNCEQAVAGFLPVEGGTVVVYGNHTSTDQVSGFGGGAKRSIGSKLMASQLEGLFAKVQKRAK
jgi:hypothetical protein